MPQIRLSARDSSANAVVTRVSVSVPAVATSGQPPASFSPSNVSASSTLRGDAANARRLVGLDRPAAVRSALNAGAIAAVASLIPLAFFLAAPLAGYFGLRLYQRRGGLHQLSTRDGFKFGALVGLCAAPIFAVLRAAEIVASGEQGELRQKMIERLQQAAAGNPDPYAHQFADYFSSPQGLIVLMIIGFVVICLAFVLLSGIGGAISASLGRKGPSA